MRAQSPARRRRLSTRAPRAREGAVQTVASCQALRTREGAAERDALPFDAPPFQLAQRAHDLGDGVQAAERNDHAVRARQLASPRHAV